MMITLTGCRIGTWSLGLFIGSAFRINDALVVEGLKFDPVLIAHHCLLLQLLLFQLERLKCTAHDRKLLLHPLDNCIPLLLLGLLGFRTLLSQIPGEGISCTPLMSYKHKRMYTDLATIVGIKLTADKLGPPEYLKNSGAISNWRCWLQRCSRLLERTETL